MTLLAPSDLAQVTAGADGNLIYSRTSGPGVVFPAGVYLAIKAIPGALSGLAAAFTLHRIYDLRPRFDFPDHPAEK
jgi:hypothetical protein